MSTRDAMKASWTRLPADKAVAVLAVALARVHVAVFGGHRNRQGGVKRIA